MNLFSWTSWRKLRWRSTMSCRRFCYSALCPRVGIPSSWRWATLRLMENSPQILSPTACWMRRRGGRSGGAPVIPKRTSSRVEAEPTTAVATREVRISRAGDRSLDRGSHLMLLLWQAGAQEGCVSHPKARSESWDCQARCDRPKEGSWGAHCRRCNEEWIRTLLHRRGQLKKFHLR